MLAPMGRVHLFEFGDQRWLPAAWRRYLIEYLRTVEELAGAKLISLVPLLRKLVRPGGHVVDLCSGAAGPWRSLREHLGEADLGDIRVTLTDLAPLPDAADGAENGYLGYHETPVDASAVPAHLEGARTMFNALHHFKPEDARRVLANAVERRRPIGAFEMLSRHPAHILTAPLIVVAVLLVTPLVRPFRWGRLLWTYLIPVVPLLVMWDGVVSALRVYSKRELKELVRGFDDYDWEIGEVKTLGPPSPYLLGLPRDG
jgi:hypothetical protein